MRPADAVETTVAWKMALENTKVPTALILSRQGIKDIPANDASRYDDALAAGKGAYAVKNTDKPDVILVGNGSEVSTLLEATALLETQKGLKVRVVSAISDGLFRQQDQAYQDALIPSDVPVFGVTAGFPETLRPIVGYRGEVFGLDHFGYSAPAKVLDEKFGFTGQQVFEKVVVFLNK